MSSCDDTQLEYSTDHNLAALLSGSITNEYLQVHNHEVHGYDLSDQYIQLSLYLEK